MKLASDMVYCDTRGGMACWFLQLQHEMVLVIIELYYCAFLLWGAVLLLLLWWQSNSEVICWKKSWCNLRKKLFVLIKGSLFWKNVFQNDRKFILNSILKHYEFEGKLCQRHQKLNVYLTWKVLLFYQNSTCSKFLLEDLDIKVHRNNWILVSTSSRTNTTVAYKSTFA